MLRHNLRALAFIFAFLLALTLFAVMGPRPDACATGITSSASPITYANRLGFASVYELHLSMNGPCTVTNSNSPLPSGWSIAGADPAGQCTITLPGNHAANPTGYLMPSVNVDNSGIAAICNASPNLSGAPNWTVTLVVTCRGTTGTLSAQSVELRYEDWSAGH